MEDNEICRMSREEIIHLKNIISSMKYSINQLENLLNYKIKIYQETMCQHIFEKFSDDDPHSSRTYNKCRLCNYTF